MNVCIHQTGNFYRLCFNIVQFFKMITFKDGQHGIISIVVFRVKMCKDGQNKLK
jgi:hypothetical protein